MFRQILWTQLKWTRTLLATLAVVAFIIPAIVWRFGSAVGATDARAIMIGFAHVGAYAMVPALLGAFLVAALPWTMDAAARHVYPLSLPLPWHRYVAMRFAAGALSLLVPAFSLWLGSLLGRPCLERRSAQQGRYPTGKT